MRFLLAILILSTITGLAYINHYADITHAICETKCQAQKDRRANMERLREAYPYATYCTPTDCYWEGK